MVSISIYTTSLEKRKKLYQEACGLVSIEFRSLCDESSINFSKWIYGELEIKDVRVLEYKRLYNEKDKYIKPIYNNRLNIVSERVYDITCSSFVTSRVIELLDISSSLSLEQLLSWKWVTKIHKIMLGDILPTAGIKRNFNLNVQSKYLHYNILKVSNHDKIEMDLNKLFEIMSNTDNITDVETCCMMLAYFCCQFYYLYPFEDGNITLALFIIFQYCKLTDFHINFLHFIKYYNRDDYIKQCILLGAYSLSNYDILGESVVNENLGFLIDIFYTTYRSNQYEEIKKLDEDNRKSLKDWLDEL